MRKNSDKKWVVYVSTFPPRECGIGTYTQDVMNAFDEMFNPREKSKVAALNLDSTSHYLYDPNRVIYQIPQREEKRYAEAAIFLNSLEQVSLVHIQHEFGIYGGEYGSYVIPLLRELKKPTVITFHSVLPNPNPVLKDMVIAINNHVQRIFVMTEISKTILQRDYGVDPEKVAVIPHGIHPMEFSRGDEVREELGLLNCTVIATFGLLGPGKGIEFGIEAMVKVVEKCPNAVYLIIGATHPFVLRDQGETYRNSLIKKVNDLKLDGHVFFYDRFIELNELLRFLQATHIYLALNQDPNQAVSGTLSYALGTGRPVVSTSFAQAKEVVTEDVGMLVDFKDSQAIADSLIKLCNDENLRQTMEKNAYLKTRGWTWRNVLLAHMTEYIRLVPALGEEEKNLPPIKLQHLSRMTDGFGLFQFANLLEPNKDSGYTVDDNARALIAVTKYYELSGKKHALPLIQTYLNFIEFVQKAEGGFHNYVTYDRQIPMEQHQRENLESASSRGLYALAVTATAQNMPERLVEQAKKLFEKNRRVIDSYEAIRSIAYGIKSLVAWNKISGEEKEKIKKLTDALVSRYESIAGPDWKWFEDLLAYSNGLLPHALLDAYGLLKDEKYLSVARESLDFLVENSFEGDMCMPIGQNGWLKRGGKKYIHDQQPEEVSVLVSSLKAMFEVTREEKYAKKMRAAFEWFLGNNSLRRFIYDQSSGGCYDGLGERSVNLNEGAESTVMYLLARLEFE